MTACVAGSGKQPQHQSGVSEELAAGRQKRCRDQAGRENHRKIDLPAMEARIEKLEEELGAR
jgi:hypothetical protein